jgi:hypothetical protein
MITVLKQWIFLKMEYASSDFSAEDYSEFSLEYDAYSAPEIPQSTNLKQFPPTCNQNTEA